MRELRESIDQPLDAVLEGLDSEVEKEADALVGEAEVVQNLCVVAGMMFVGCFDLDDHLLASSAGRTFGAEVWLRPTWSTTIRSTRKLQSILAPL